MKLAVAYRIYPGVSKTPFLYPERFRDKLSLSRAALKSFRAALGNLDVKLFAILDGCPVEYEDLFREFFGDEQLEIHALPGVGNDATFGKQIELLCGQDFAEAVYFAEDDYAYLPGAMEEAVRFLEDSAADFVSLYDHPGYYGSPFDGGVYRRRESAGRSWRTGASTCLTFLSTRETLREAEGVLRTYCRGNSDSGLWTAMTKHRIWNFARIAALAVRDPGAFRSYRRAWRYGWSQHLFGRKFDLWFPIPSLGTHLEAEFLAPGVDWAEVLGESA